MGELASKLAVDSIPHIYSKHAEDGPLSALRRAFVESNSHIHNRGHLGSRTPATRLSDGTLRWLALLVILLNPTPAPVTCIDEPELGLHPDAIHTLADLLVEASTRTQLVVTTHSDALLDAFTDTPEVVCVCEKVEGSTGSGGWTKND